jgi:hypothetical protein
VESICQHGGKKDGSPKQQADKDFVEQVVRVHG